MLYELRCPNPACRRRLAAHMDGHIVIRCVRCKTWFEKKGSESRILTGPPELVKV